MRKEITLNIKPYSVNAMYYGDARTQRSEFKEWTYQVFHQLSTVKNLETMKELHEAFDPHKHSFVVTFTAYYPRQIFKTKDGRISAKTMDLSNFEKPLADLLFDKKFYDREHPYGCKNINQNDCYISELHSFKKPGDAHSIHIIIEIVNIEPLLDPQLPE